MRQVTEGYLCLFTLKNPSYPEYINSTESGVMCLDFHPQHPYLVVVGLYDGTVAVYNIQLPTKERQFQSNSVTNKHGGIVWQVQLVVHTYISEEHRLLLVAHFILVL